jgi:energy-coupling factor transport system ATP-binding protein
MTAIIALHNVRFTYSIGTQPALNDITLEVPAGQMCCVVGRAGAGKSTLCALCAGFIPNFYQGAFSGSAQIDGQDVIEHAVADLVRHVGLVGSNAFSQITGARFTVYEEIGFALENLGLPRHEIAERIEWAIDAMQLGELRDRSPYALSGGQQQRLVLAATLAMRPSVLVLDEPTAQLDQPTLEKLAELLRSLSRHGTTILFAEHRLEWAAEIADRVIALDEGRVIADGSSAEVLTNPLVRDRGVGWPRPTQLADRARAQGLWPAERALPITLADLVAGLREKPVVGGPLSEAGDQAQRTTDHRPPTTDHRPPLIAVEDIRFSYPSGVEALRGVSLNIGSGERIALLGRNGAGKSTLLRHLNGLLLPSAGRVTVAQTDTRSTTVARCARHVGIVFQDIRNQLFARTVRDELRFGPRNLGYNASQVDTMVARAMDALGLADVADVHPYDLPPALRRMVAIGAVLAMQSDVLILDEPTAGLDNPSIARLANLATTLASQGKTIVVVSHDLDFCFEALDRVILLKDGQLTLDTRWSAMDSDARGMLADTVGLPLALAAAEALGAIGASPLSSLFTNATQTPANAQYSQGQT